MATGLVASCRQFLSQIDDSFETLIAPTTYGSQLDTDFDSAAGFA